MVGGGDRLIGGQSEEERLDRAWGGGLSQVWLSVAITGSSITSIVMGHMNGPGVGSSMLILLYLYYVESTEG